MSGPQLVPLNVAARQLQVPLKWLKKEAEEGRIPVLNADGKFLCDTNSVEASLLGRIGCETKNTTTCRAILRYLLGFKSNGIRLYAFEKELQLPFSPFPGIRIWAGDEEPFIARTVSWNPDCQEFVLIQSELVSSAKDLMEIEKEKLSSGWKRELLPLVASN